MSDALDFTCSLKVPGDEAPQEAALIEGVHFTWGVQYSPISLE